MVIETKNLEFICACNWGALKGCKVSKEKLQEL
jgi:hypothetical protein